MAGEENVNDEDKMLADLEAEMVADGANSLLDRQLGRAKKWIAQREANGESATLYDFTKRCMQEPNKRRHLIMAYCAAMWRLIHQEDR